MANKVYLTVCDALSLIVSRRAAENIVRDALALSSLDADRITVREMQDLLRGRIFARLQTIMPVAQARGEIKVLLAKLDANARTVLPLTPEVLEGLEALSAEFAPFVSMDHPRVDTLRVGIETLPDSSDPIKALNALWTELDLLQQESGLGRRDDDPFGEPDGEFEGVDLDFLEAEFAREDSQVSQHLEPPVSQVDSAQPVPTQPVSVQPVSAQTISAQAAPTAVLTRARVRQLGTPEVQDRLLSRFALEEGVLGVALTDRSGGVVQARLPDGESTELAGVTAATVMLLGKHRTFEVFYANLNDASVFIAPIEDLLLTVLADAHVNVGRVLSEIKTIKEEL